MNYSDESFVDDPTFGLNEHFGEQSRIFNKQQLEKTKRIKLDKNAKTITYVLAGREQRARDLSLVRMRFIEQNWHELKGNTLAATYAVRTTVGGYPFLFKTSYNQDIGLSPLILNDNGSYSAGKNRPYTEITGDLDDYIDGDEDLRQAVGEALLSVRDTGTASLADDLGLDDVTALGLSQLIAELGVVLRLDLIRAEDQRDNAAQHQDELIGGELDFADIFAQGTYLGMKAEALRNPDNYP